MIDKLLYLVPMYMFIGVFMTQQATSEDETDKGHTWLYVKMMFFWLPAMLWYSFRDKDSAKPFTKNEQ